MKTQVSPHGHGSRYGDGHLALVLPEPPLTTSYQMAGAESTDQVHVVLKQPISHAQTLVA